MKLIKTMATIAALTFSMAASAATIGNSVTTGNSSSYTEIKQVTTGKVTINSVGNSKTSGGFDRGVRCYTQCDGVEDIAGTGSATTENVTNITVKLNEVTTGNSLTTTEFCDTTLIAGDTLISNGSSSSQTDSYTTTERDNVTKIKSVTVDSSHSISDDGLTASYNTTTTTQKIKQTDNSIVNSESHSFTESIFTSAE